MNTRRLLTSVHTRRRHLRALLATSGIAMLPACATILHPERRGNNRRPIALGSLVMDILWFIPGLIPGIVALAVDFSSGAIYLGGGDRHATGPTPAGVPRHAIRPGETMTVRPPEASTERMADLDVALRLCSPRGELLDECTGRWTPDGGDALRVTFAEHRSEHHGSGYLELSLPRSSGITRHPIMRHPLQLSRDPSLVVG